VKRQRYQNITGKFCTAENSAEAPQTNRVYRTSRSRWANKTCRYLNQTTKTRKFMKQGPSGRAHRRIGILQIPTFLPNSKVHCHAHNSLSLASICSDTKKLHTLRIHFNGTLQYKERFSKSVFFKFLFLAYHCNNKGT